MATCSSWNSGNNQNQSTAVPNVTTVWQHKLCFATQSEIYSKFVVHSFYRVLGCFCLLTNSRLQNIKYNHKATRVIIQSQWKPDTVELVLQPNNLIFSTEAKLSNLNLCAILCVGWDQDVTVNDTLAITTLHLKIPPTRWSECLLAVVCVMILEISIPLDLYLVMSWWDSKATVISIYYTC